jgi:chromate transporter
MAMRSAQARLASLVPAFPLFAATDISPHGLFAVFVRIGFSVFGSGYVLLAYLEDLLVHDLGLVSRTQVLDAVAIGQVTPGPVFTTATFLGFVIDGIPGAVLATAGIFLPSFLLVALVGPFIPRLRERPAAAAFVDGVNAVAIGVMATVLVDFGATVRQDVVGIVVAIAATVAVVLLKRSPTQVLLAGAAIGAVRALLG